ncbi:hypothetical protein CSAL01_07279 [Colletotrichum salicis]|uniref:Uncharacterized protein n=1 Tax=Colletotrichum salicis TaxID=1209931 RepID=A0A135TIP9_9PEZI|nr:hypothetical protein CSAL01_07279 [Colletotrichum salicis]
MVATPESSPAYSMSSTPWPNPEPGQALWKSQSWAGWTRDLEDELKTIQAEYDDYIDHVEDRLRSEKKKKKALIREVQRLNEELNAAKKVNDIEKMQRQNALALIDAARQELVTSASEYDSKTSFMRMLTKLGLSRKTDSPQMPQDLYPKRTQLPSPETLMLLISQHGAFDFPSTALIAERDPTRPDPTRNLLIDRVCLEDIREIYRIDPRNKDAVARINLGRRRAPGTPPPWTFSLRNYNLQPDQMINLHMPVEYYAEHMARTLAHSH